MDGLVPIWSALDSATALALASLRNWVTSLLRLVRSPQHRHGASLGLP